MVNHASESIPEPIAQLPERLGDQNRTKLN